MAKRSSRLGTIADYGKSIEQYRQQRETSGAEQLTEEVGKLARQKLGVGKFPICLSSSSLKPFKVLAV